MNEQIMDRMGTLLNKMDQFRRRTLREGETESQLEAIVCEFEQLWPFWRQAAEQAGVRDNLLQEVESGMSQVALHLPSLPIDHSQH